MDDTFYEILKKVVSKHKRSFKTIYSTNGVWQTSPFKLWMFLTMRIIKLRVKIIRSNESRQESSLHYRGKKSD